MQDTNKEYIKNIFSKQPVRPEISGHFQLPPGEILAPMAGVTDSPFRRIARRYGAGLLFTECISAEGIRRSGHASFELARFHPEERPIAVQLFGREPEQFADAAAMIAEFIQPDLIDINCGCPVKKFVTRSCGGFLMQDPDLIGRIVEAVRLSSRIPVSVKIRSGYRKPDETASDAAVAAEAAGAVVVSVHGRYVRGSKDDKADWDVIGRVKTALKTVPVIGNGDIKSFPDIVRMKNHSGCDRVMIGRWARGRPWVFTPQEDRESESVEFKTPDYHQRIHILIEHYHLMLSEFPTLTAVHRMRKHIGWYSHSLPGASAMRRVTMLIEDPDDVLKALNDYQEILRKNYSGRNTRSQIDKTDEPVKLTAC